MAKRPSNAQTDIGEYWRSKFHQTLNNQANAFEIAWADYTTTRRYFYSLKHGWPPAATLYGVDQRVARNIRNLLVVASVMGVCRLTEPVPKYPRHKDTIHLRDFATTFENEDTKNEYLILSETAENAGTPARRLRNKHIAHMTTAEFNAPLGDEVESALRAVGKVFDFIFANKFNEDRPSQDPEQMSIIDTLAEKLRTRQAALVDIARLLECLAGAQAKTEHREATDKVALMLEVSTAPRKTRTPSHAELRTGVFTFLQEADEAEAEVTRTKRALKMNSPTVKAAPNPPPGSP